MPRQIGRVQLGNNLFHLVEFHHAQRIIQRILIVLFQNGFEIRPQIIGGFDFGMMAPAFGGIDIIVPEDVKVVISSASFFGGAENKRKNNENWIYIATETYQRAKTQTSVWRLRDAITKQITEKISKMVKA